MADSIAQEADGIRRSLEHAAKQIKSDADLNSEARRRRLGEAHSAAKTRMDALRARVRADRERNHQAATARLAGGNRENLGADAISMRDATERASRLETAAEGRRLIARARVNGDTTLVRAVLVEAQERSQQPIFGHHWGELLKEEAASGDRVATDLAAFTGSASHDGGTPFEDIGKYLLPSLSDLTWDVA